MKKTRISIVLFFLLSFSLFASIREAVCIVEPEYSKALSKKMNKIAKSFKNFGYEDVAEVFTKSVEKGAFGSGFIYNYKGRNFVITNEHVVSYADLASIEIQNSQGDTVKKLEHCKVIARSEELDLAIIELPKNAKITQSLSLYEGRLRDGIDVFSAGYPGLIDNPAWQLGKGNITNSMLKLPELIDPKKSYFIQHSAPIDPGNSGGPLLIPNSRTKMGYQVVGVNSIKAIYRETTNFAIPVSTIKRFIKTSLVGINKAQKQNMFNQSAKSFVNCENISDEINKKYFAKLRQLMLMIDNDYALENGYPLLKSLLLKAPSKIRAGAIVEIKKSFPAEALKYAVAYEMLKNLQDYPKLAIEDSKLTGANSAIANYKVNENKLNSNWLFVNNTWKIKDYSLNGKKSSKTKRNSKTDSDNDYSDDEESDSETAKSIEFKMPYTFEAYLGYNFIHLPINKNSSGFIYAMAIHSNYFGAGAKLGIQKTVQYKEDEYDSFGSNDSKVSMSMLFFSELHVPIYFVEKDFAIIPYVNAGIGLRFKPIYGPSSFASFSEMFTFEVSPGMKFVFNTSAVPIIVSGGYRLSKHQNSLKKEHLHGFDLSIGIGF